MKSVETRGKTVEEAVELALSKLGAKREDVEVTVLEEPSKGFLGILGQKDARVRVTLVKQKVEIAREFLAGVLERMGVQASIETRTQGDTKILDVVGNDLGLLIGRRGQTLSYLEFLTNLVCSKGQGDEKRIVVDVAGYRRRREKELEEMAKSYARRVVRTGKSIALEPMDARSRRAIHMALQNDEKVMTKSEGEEPFRRVVISLRKPSEGNDSGKSVDSRLPAR